MERNVTKACADFSISMAGFESSEGDVLSGTDNELPPPPPSGKKKVKKGFFKSPTKNYSGFVSGHRCSEAE